MVKLPLPVNAPSLIIVSVPTPDKKLVYTVSLTVKFSHKKSPAISADKN